MYLNPDTHTLDLTHHGTLIDFIKMQKLRFSVLVSRLPRVCRFFRKRLGRGVLPHRLHAFEHQGRLARAGRALKDAGAAADMPISKAANRVAKHLVFVIPPAEESLAPYLGAICPV